LIIAAFCLAVQKEGHGDEEISFEVMLVPRLSHPVRQERSDLPSTPVFEGMNGISNRVLEEESSANGFERQGHGTTPITYPGARPPVSTPRTDSMIRERYVLRTVRAEPGINLAALHTQRRKQQVQGQAIEMPDAVKVHTTPTHFAQKLLRV
jgi:hypothetical protein